MGLIKIVVYDSSGDEHIFNHDDTAEQYIKQNVYDDQDKLISGSIQITTRLFEDGPESFTGEVESIFHMPRRVDIYYDGYS